MSNNNEDILKKYDEILKRAERVLEGYDRVEGVLDSTATKLQQKELFYNSLGLGRRSGRKPEGRTDYIETIPEEKKEDKPAKKYPTLSGGKVGGWGFVTDR